MKAKIVKAPTAYLHYMNRKRIFLAGSIEMGAAEDWQERLTQNISDLPITILNPRRDDWDSSWEQKKDNPQFRKQVEWELNALDHSHVIALYFDPNTMSPISLLELGLFIYADPIVYCPEGFWRKGNVDIVCERFGITVYEDEVEWLAHIRMELSS